MARHLNILLTDKQIETLDNYLETREDAKPKPLTPDERKHAYELAEAKGIASANAYLRTIRPPKPKLSRTGLVEYLVQIGIESLNLKGE